MKDLAKIKRVVNSTPQKHNICVILYQYITRSTNLSLLKKKQKKRPNTVTKLPALHVSTNRLVKTTASYSLLTSQTWGGQTYWSELKCLHSLHDAVLETFPAQKASPLVEHLFSGYSPSLRLAFIWLLHFIINAY